MDLLNKIKMCETSRQLDELRIEIVRSTKDGTGDFNEMQKAFIKKKNSLKRNGHTSNTEGYTVREIIKEQAAKGLFD